MRHDPQPYAGAKGFKREVEGVAVDVLVSVQIVAGDPLGLGYPAEPVCLAGAGCAALAGDVLGREGMVCQLGQAALFGVDLGDAALFPKVSVLVPITGFAGFFNLCCQVGRFHLWSPW